MRRGGRYNAYTQNGEFVKFFKEPSGEFVVMDEFSAYIAKDSYDERELYDALKTFKMKSIQLPVGTRIKFFSPTSMFEDIARNHSSKQLENEINLYALTDKVTKVQFVSCNKAYPYLFISSNDIIRRTITTEVFDRTITFKKKRIFGDEEDVILEINQSDLGLPPDLSKRFSTYISTRLVFLFSNGTNTWLSKNEKPIIELVTKTVKYAKYHNRPAKMIDITSSILERYCEQMKYGQWNMREKIPHYDVRDLILKAIEEKNKADIKTLSHKQMMEMEAINHMEFLENSWKNIVRSIMS